MRHLLPFALIAATAAAAQPFAIGTISTSYYDAQRSRSVTCEVYYPATSMGTGTPVEAGAFPLLVVGHGFVMSVNAYTYLQQYFVPMGYIVVLPTTESGFAPDHAAFGADIAFLSAALRAAHTDPLSPFFGHVQPLTALMGHSMGGGAAFLGTAGNADVQALVVMAPAETNPSAIAAASTVQVPTLVFAASEDCVTPIADHAQPMYDALVQPCRAFVNITGGGHCYFGDSNFNCTFGELTCGPNLTISRADQQDVVTDIAELWLRVHLFGDVGADAALTDSLANSTRFVGTSICLTTGTDGAGEMDRWSAVATADGLQVTGLWPGDEVRCHDAVGRLLGSAIAGGGSSLVLGIRSSGLLLISVHRAGGVRVQQLVVGR